MMLRILAENPSPWTGPDGNNTYLLPGSVPTLVDAGVGNPAHVDAVSRALGDSRLVRVLITHSHPDHAAGVPALRDRWPEVDIRNIAPDLCHDGEVIAAGDARLVALHTPGHAPDHCCFFDEETRDLFCGDLARRGGTIVVPASKGGNLAEYLASLRRIRDLAPARLLPGHGPVIEDVAAILDEYLKHRADREREVLDALTSGCETVGPIVDRIYSGLHPSVVPAAADSVLAHLIKLRDEGKVVRSADHWRLVE